MTDVSDATVQQRTRPNGVLTGEVTAAGSELSEDEKKELAALLDDHSMSESERERAKEHFYQSVRRRREYPLLMSFTDPIKAPAREIVGRDYEISQLMAAMNRPELCNAILLAPAGSGKALTNGTPIPVADARGYVPIEQLVAGDQTFDETGAIINVTGVFPQGKKRVYRVHFSDGTSRDCCDEHLWNVRSIDGRKKDRPYKTMTLREIMDRGIKDASGKNNQWSIPVGSAVDRPAIDLPLDPYAMGVLIAEGSLTFREGRASGGPLVISSIDEPVVAAVAEALGAPGYAKSEHNHGWQFYRKDSYVSSRGRQVKYIQLSDLESLDDFDGALGMRSAERRIPEQYLLGSIDQRMALLQGLFDTDGNVTSNDRTNVTLSTSSQGLVEDVQELLASVGVRSSVTVVNRKSRDTGPEYTVHTKLADEDKPAFFRLQRHLSKLERFRKQDRKFVRGYTDLRIEAVEDLGYEEEMTCIKVDGASELFVSGREHIVTHNTALVQAAMLQDVKRTYLEIDLARMIAGLNTPDEMASLMKGLFDDAERFSNNEDEQLVLFIDEFHQVVQLSAASVEALKPVLAASGARGIRVIAATTFEEFHQFIAPNQPLVQRLQRINVASPDSKTTVEILRGMAEKYGVGDQFYDDHVFKMIYEYTERFQPANSQPRKSILLLDAMVGWHRHTGRPMDRALLADVLMESTGINVAFRVDAAAIKENLDRAVFGQDMATRVLAKRLQLTVADLHDKSKPNASFLFAGSTGVGKFCTDSTPVPVFSGDGSVAWKNHGDLVTGDQVFTRTGTVSEVLGVFPQGEQDIYRVTLSDGRTLEVGGPHLWAVWTERGLVNVTTEDLLAQGLRTLNGRGEQVLRHWIPMNEPVQWPAARQRMDPYIVGLLLSTGWLSGSTTLLWYGAASLAVQIAESLGVSDWAVVEEGEGGEDLYRFDLGGLAIELRSHLAVLLNRETGIHPDYLYGSVDQRRALSQGIFDAGGYAVPISGGRALLGWVCHEKQQQLAESVSHLLFSLGVSNTLSQDDLEGDAADWYQISVEASRGKAEKLFSDTSVLVDLLEGNELSEGGGDYVGISSIEKLPEQQSASCIYIEDEEHLYQAGEFIVTHNTELTKQLAKLLFGDAQNHMIRFDMSEYALEHSVETFRSELTRKVWDTGHAVLLFDEIEKAASTVTRVLLQVLDDGRLSDDNGRQVSFLNTYIVLTTNAGSEIFETIAQYNVDDEGSGKEMEGKMKEIKRSISSTTGDNKFPPELLGRIDAIVPFQPLSRETQRKIVRNKLKKVVQEVLTKHGARVHIDDRVLVYLVDDQVDTDASAGGARDAIQKMTDHVLTEIAAFVNHHPKEKAVVVGIEGTLKAEDKRILESSAKVEVSAARSSMR